MSSLPDEVEDALADALLRASSEREARLAVLREQYPELRVALAARIDEWNGMPAAAARPDEPALEVVFAVGARVGRYQLLEHLADGGMGTVWRAEQREPISREVALKFIKLGMDTAQFMARFEAERQALAMMDHPNIAKVFDAGSTVGGRPYFVMEYIRGTPILVYCEHEQVSTEGRLRLFVDVCRAIQHAHQKGVIHRDIKSSNVMVSQHDGVPVPKVIDFGVAKATSGELGGHTLVTQHRQVLGTPAYMSPEQIDASGIDVDTRSDVYSLGVLLYELLTGTTPFDNEELLSGGYAEMLRTIREVEPLRPSTRVTLHGGRGVGRAPGDVARSGQRLRGELDWIVMKCLEKDRGRRYDTATGLAADISRFLANEPVLAGPPGAGYRVAKFIRRNRGRVLAATAVAVVLVLGAIVSVIGWLRALDEQRNADEVVAFMNATLRGVDPSVAKGRDITMLKEMMDVAAARIARGELADVPAAEVRLGTTIGDIYRRLALYQDAREMLVPTLERARAIWPEGHVQVAFVLASLATLDYVQGNLTAAEPQYREALSITERQLVGDDRRVAAAMGNLAVLLQARGELDEAERLYRRGLAINRRLAAGDHRSVAWFMQALATLLTVRGDHEAAEPLYVESLAMNRRLFPGDDPGVATGLGHLAILHHGRNELEQAEQHYRESLAMNRRLHEGDHPSVATGLNTLATLLRDKGDLEEATRMFVESMDMSRRLFSGDEPNRDANLDALAHLYWLQGEFEKAIPLLVDALAARETMFGRGNVAALAIVLRLGKNHAAAGQIGAALPLLEEAARASLEHPELSEARQALLAACARARGQFDPVDRDRLVRLVLELHAVEQAQAGDGSARANAHVQHANALLGLESWDAAEPLLRAAVAARMASAPNDWLQLRDRALLGRCLAGQRRDDAAKAMLLQLAGELVKRREGLPSEAWTVEEMVATDLCALCERAGDEAAASAWRRRRDAAGGQLR